ncbi:hypothetical protein Undi14_01415 [Undibacterium sp. 14-3-2]|uniref:DUF6765 family protein n=1 Tax=Undibacterium sp. 14-3-2 TaxID=2800129 RepID=UPI0019078ABA|nr:DUF6765 family protein [Undibacterium sp. 14-3-2]MBK1888675.1 hypothetical protein [Undibacterium sp. 14-3-2]
MQIDFHNAVTYVVARLAGFSHDKAHIVAYSAQYVDDATNDGYVTFDTGAMYARIASAHKMLDYTNFDALANHHAWIPFHFLPGNNGLPSDQGGDLDFIQKIVCRPNSHIAQDMVRECIHRKDDKNALHRLGITMHVYADTWAHQGFVGTVHEINKTTQLKSMSTAISTNAMIAKVKDYFSNLIDHTTGSLVASALPLGHGTVLSYPDQPYLKWKYTNSNGEEIIRDNPNDFLEAADRMCIAMRSFIAGDVSLSQSGLDSIDKSTIKNLILKIDDNDGDVRHTKWVKAIKDGDFSFGKSDLAYIAKGEKSWKYLALGTKESTDSPGETFAYDASFLDSDWKRFHDALQMHQLYVVQNLLPRYGICAA